MSFIPPALKERPVENVKEELHYYLWEQHRVRTIVWITVVVLLELGLAYLTLTDPSAHVQTFITFGVFIGMILAIPYGIAQANIQARYRKHLARMLGYTYTPTLLQESVSGHLFTFSQTYWLSNAFVGTYKDYPLRHYALTFHLGEGRSKQMIQLFVWEFDIDTTVPTLMIRPHGLVNGLNWQPPGRVPLRLEGDFNKYFDVWVTDQMEIEGLVVLEPYFMTVLIDQYRDYGITTHEQKLYLFRKEPVPEYTTAFVEALAKAKHLFDETLPELLQISGDTVALHAAFNKKTPA